MKIKELDIYGYGKWVNQQFSIDNHLHIFYGPNESGKSTIQSFIRSILFGFPTRRRRKDPSNRYEPKKGDLYGGRILIESDSEGDLWIERKGKTLSLYTPDGKQLKKDVMEQILGGLDVNLYDHFYGITLKNLQDLVHLGADELNDAFLSIGTMGSENFLSLANQFEKLSDEIYRPQGSKPLLNQALNDYQSLSEHYLTLQNQQKDFNHLLEQRDEKENEIASLEEKQEALNQDIKAQEQLVERYDQYQRFAMIERQLADLTETPMNDDDEANLIYYNKMIEQKELQKIQVQEKNKWHRDQLTELTRLNWAKNHQEERQSWLKLTQDIKETQIEIEKTEQSIQEKIEQQKELAQTGKFILEKIPNEEEYQERLQTANVLLDQEKIFTQDYNILKMEQQFVNQQRKEQQEYSVTVKQQIVSLENQRMNDKERLIQETSLKEYLLGLVFLIVGLTGSLLQWLSNDPHRLLQTIAVILIIIGIVFIVIVYRKHRQFHHDYAKSPILDKLAQLKKDDELYQKQIKDLNELFSNYNKKIEKEEISLEEHRNKMTEWLTDTGFQPDADIELIIKTNPIENYFKIEQSISKLQKKLEDLTSRLYHWKDQLRPFFERFPSSEIGTRALIRHVEETEATLAEMVRKGDSLNKKIAENDETIQQLTEEIEKYQSNKDDILTATQSENVEQFQQKLAINKEIMELTQEKQLLLDRISDYLDELSNIENKEELLEQSHVYQHRLHQLSMQKNKYQHELADIVAKINQMLQDGTIQEAKQSLANKKAEIRDLVVDWGSKQTSIYLLRETLRYGLENPLPEMTQLATKLFEQLTSGRYKQIKMNKTNVKVVHQSDILFEPYELSQGTLEQLYIALRFAFIICAHKLIKMPMIIDDAFVNFDEYRKRSMYEVLEDVSQEIQILYFTFDDEVKTAFSEENITDLTQLTE